MATMARQLTCTLRALVLVPAVAAGCGTDGPLNADGGQAKIPENTAAKCQDGLDNDGDGLVDCRDPDCAALTFCPDAGIPKDGRADSDALPTIPCQTHCDCPQGAFCYYGK
jgi:hypothetical protein